MAAAEIGVAGAILPPWTAVAEGWRNHLSHGMGEIPTSTETGKGPASRPSLRNSSDGKESDVA